MTCRALAALVAVAAAALVPAGRAAAPRPLAEERCFGAAARDPDRRCHNPRLRNAVVPTPRRAITMPAEPCTVTRREPPLTCEFGVPAARARETIALVGDSHAVHWRAALARVARRRGWRGVTLTELGCPLSTALRVLGPEIERTCLSWRRALQAWFAVHPEVRTVVVSQLAALAPVHGDGDRFEREVRGFLEAWDALPASVERIVVIRDSPRFRAATWRCVERERRRRRPAGTRCALPRREVLLRDPAAVAARRTRSPRVGLVDLTRFFCDRHRCPPVIGGALVLKDLTHQTATFNATLAPYLDDALQRLRRRRSA